MRISLLVEREPFAEILVKTLTSHWKCRYEIQCELSWLTNFQPKPSDGTILSGNSLLNFIVSSDVSTGSLENITREYSLGEGSYFFRLLRKTYVGLATSSLLRSLLSDFSIHSSVPIPRQDDSVILGGNRRLRILHPTNQSCEVILKNGFPDLYISNDVLVRQLVDLDCAPKLLSSGQQDGWYEEEYFSGTPLNRIISINEMEAGVSKVAQLLWDQLTLPTMVETPLSDYVQRLDSRFSALISKMSDQSLLEKVDALYGEIRTGLLAHAAEHEKIHEAWTHGDLQSGNVLTKDGVLKIIDWECARVRPASFDYFVLNLKTRQFREWGNNFNQHLKESSNSFFLGNMKSIGANSIVQNYAFLLEELLFSMEESFEVNFVSVSEGFINNLCQIKKSLCSMGD